MATSAFDDQSRDPETRQLKHVLGRSSALWDALLPHLATEYAPLTDQWKYYSKASGWTLQLKQKKRTVLYMTPAKGHYLASFVLGEKAVKAARQSDLPDPLLEEIEGARKYVEGRGVRIEVRTRRDLANVQKLAAIKMAN